MVSKARKTAAKQFLGTVPLTAELYWWLWQQGKPLSRSFSLERTRRQLPIWCAQARAAADRKVIESELNPQRVLVFSTLRYWIEHAALVSIAVAGLGHDVTFAYLPYANWWRPIKRFDLRRHNAYAQRTYEKAVDLIHPLSLYNGKAGKSNHDIANRLPSDLVEQIYAVAMRDTQYTLQLEVFDKEDKDSKAARLYQLRIERNLQAASAAVNWINSLSEDRKPQVVITPNGSILEMGAIYQVAKFLEIPTVTYEFGEQRGRMWLAQNAQVMHQETNLLWEARKDKNLSEGEWEKLRSLFSSRKQASLWENFSRLWQDTPSQGGEQVRRDLGLDERPVVLLAANVIGDSLTLGRQIFTENMTEWLRHTIRDFSLQSDSQLLIRVHPGERYTKGPSVSELVSNSLTNLPSHIHLINADDPINTYDLLEIADLGLVYTTTVGMEMAMAGVPAIVVGQTHYRGKGFSLDPQSWQEYHRLVKMVLEQPQLHRLSKDQIERAWQYAYLFYFEYPCPFPWHMKDFWKEMDTWSLERVLSEEGQHEFGDTFHYLVGIPRDTKHPISIMRNDPEAVKL